MKKIITSVLTFTLALIMALSSFSVNVFASNQNVSNEYTITYTEKFTTEYELEMFIQENDVEKSLANELRASIVEGQDVIVIDYEILTPRNGNARFFDLNKLRNYIYGRGSRTFSMAIENRGNITGTINSNVVLYNYNQYLMVPIGGEPVSIRVAPGQIGYSHNINVASGIAWTDGRLMNYTFTSSNTGQKTNPVNLIF